MPLAYFANKWAGELALRFTWEKYTVWNSNEAKLIPIITASIKARGEDD